MKIIKGVAGMLFNWVFANLVTLLLVAKLSASIFAHNTGGKVLYQAANGEITESQLFCLDVWSDEVKQLSMQVGEQSVSKVFREVELAAVDDEESVVL